HGHAPALRAVSAGGGAGGRGPSDRAAAARRIRRHRGAVRAVAGTARGAPAAGGGEDAGHGNLAERRRALPRPHSPWRGGAADLARRPDRALGPAGYHFRGAVERLGARWT